MDKYIDTEETAEIKVRDGWGTTSTKTFPVKLELTEEIPLLVSFGLGGHSVDFAPKKTSMGSSTSRLSGYDRPETMFAVSRWWAHDFAHRLDPKPYENVPYIDKRDCIENGDGRKLVISGPMCDPTLPEGTISDPLGNESKFEGKYTGLSCVSLDVYLKLWKDIGAEVGVIKSGQFKPS